MMRKCLAMCCTDFTLSFLTKNVCSVTVYCPHVCCSGAVCKLEVAIIATGLKSSVIMQLAGSSQELLVLVKNTPGKCNFIP